MVSLVLLVSAGLALWFFAGAAIAVVAGRLIARRDDPAIVALETARAHAVRSVRSYAA